MPIHVPKSKGFRPVAAGQALYVYYWTTHPLGKKGFNLGRVKTHGSIITVTA